MKQLTNYEGLHCANCGASMQGEFCHECGQSIHSVIRPVHSMLEDTLDIVLHVDGRVVHTIPPLLVRPGFLTLEYFSGRRTRYVAPFRLMFVLCLLAFFVSHFVFEDINLQIETDTTVTVAAFRQAQTPAEVQQALQNQLEAMNASEQEATMPTMATKALDASKQALRQQADLRLHELGATAATGQLAQPLTMSVAGKPLDQRWDPQKDPIALRWLPDFANRRLQQMALHMRANIDALSDRDPANKAEAIERIKAGVFGALPQTMFVLIPVFAVLLKLVYLSRRRLYMEHLIVALHSHAFLFLTLLLAMSVHLLARWLTPHAAWLGSAMGWLETGLCLWVPVYLLIMQKRIYRQGWPITTVKYLVAGWCYVNLLALALAAATLLGMAH